MRSAVLILAPFAIGCGSSPSTPSKSLPIVQVTIAPNPVVASVISIGPNGTVFRVQGTATFQETAGTAGHLTTVFGVVMQTSGGRASGTLVVDLQLAALGSASGMFSQDVALDNIANAVWQLSASGTDEAGRSFSTQIGQVAIAPPPQMTASRVARRDLSRILDTALAVSRGGIAALR